MARFSHKSSILVRLRVSFSFCPLNVTGVRPAGPVQTPRRRVKVKKSFDTNLDFYIHKSPK